MRKSRVFIGLILIVLFAGVVSCSTDSKSLKCTPNSLAFGNVNLGDYLAKDIVIKNKYGKELLITNIDITGSTDFIFASSVNLPINLLNNAEFTLSIKFTPTLAGNSNATLLIVHDASTKAKSVDITATGVAVPKIDISENSHDFGMVLINTPEHYGFTIENIGTADLTISSFNFMGTGASAYSISAGGLTPYVVSPGNTHVFEVQFNPTTVGNKTAELQIHHDGVNVTPPLTITFDGEGVLRAAEFTLNQTNPWDFGVCSVTFKSKLDLVIESNGLYDLNITSATLVNGTAFSISEIKNNNGNVVNLPQTVLIGDVLTIGLEFEPTVKQIYNETLTIVHDATNHSQPLDVTISGEGIDLRTETFVYTGSNQTWTVPAGVVEARVLVVGAGGGGSGSHYGGGGSGYSIVKTENVSGTITIVVGKGGAGGIVGTNSSPGDPGLDSKFGTAITATGGKGGGGGGAGYYTGGDGGSGGGGAGNMGSGGDGGTAGSNGLPGNTYAGGLGGHFDSLAPLLGNTFTAGAGGAAGTSSHAGGGGGGGVLINGNGPNGGDGGDTWSGKGGKGYGAGGGSGGYSSTTGTRPGGGKGADGVVYIEY